MRALALRFIVVCLSILVACSHQGLVQQADLGKAEALNRQVMQLLNQGRYGEAIPLAQRALAIREQALGPEHPDVATSLNNLAYLYKTLGDYPKAEPLYQRALAIQEKALGPEHPDVALSLNNLAEFYRALGDYANAMPLLQRALAIKEKALGPEHPDVATSLISLAELYRAAGDYAKAMPLAQRALAIYEQALGPEHPDVATSLNNLAGFYQALGDYARAMPLYQRNLAIWEKAFGPEHPTVATSLNNLALLYDSLGDYAKAEPLYQRALAIREKALGPDHPDVATSLNNLAGLLVATGRVQPARALFMRSQMIDANVIDQVMGFTSEEQKLTFLFTREGNLHTFLSLVYQALRADPAARAEALTAWLQRKGVALEAQKRFQEALAYSEDPEVAKVFQELAAVRADLSRLVFGGPGKAGAEAYRQRLADLEASKAQLEARLSTLSQAFATRQKVARADARAVALALPKDTALLEFARINVFDFTAKGTETRWKPPRYLAFILHAGTWDQVGLVDLGEAEKIEKAIGAFRQTLTAGTDPRDLKVVQAARTLHDLVFAPLTQELGTVREVFLSPDGALSLIPFEILQGPDGKFLIEDYTFNYLAAGRDLLGFGEARGKSEKPLLLGDPDFDMTPTGKGGAPSAPDSEPRRTAASTRSRDMRSIGFSRLPGTRQEVLTIGGLLGMDKAAVYTSREAVEERLTWKEPPRILHLATHGFFLTDQELGELTAGPAPLGEMGMPARRKGPPIENPLLRSGLALAGANTALRSGDETNSQGIVTAEKILGLRLRGTELVVLSACDTGVGEVKSGEGVFGLRRAFTQAGTKGLVMSLWSVPDRETKELMIEFYKNLLSGKMNRNQALRQAVLTQMQVVRARYSQAHPFFWGAFVFLGEP